MLHIVNKSPFMNPALESCLQCAGGGEVLLIEDAVYGAVAGTQVTALIEAACKTIRIHVLQPDLDARGVSGPLIKGITAVDYAGFVDLVSHNKTCQSWL